MSAPRSSARLRADAVRGDRCRNLIAVVENPDDLGNFGAVVRNVNALGVDRVYVVDRRAALPDDWQAMRRTTALTRTSASGVRWSFVKRFADTEGCLAHLERNGFRSIVTSPHRLGRTHVELAEGDYTRHKKLAVWFGNERLGISELAAERSELCVSVAMHGMVESLNLATTSGIVLHEVARQRRGFQARLRERRATRVAEQAV